MKIKLKLSVLLIFALNRITVNFFNYKDTKN